MVIGFIGGGNMATALISGLRKAGIPGLEIRVADPSESARIRLQARFGAEVFSDGAPAVQGADVIVLAVKPQNMPEVLQSLANCLQSGQLVLSVAAGTASNTLESALAEGQAVVRAMPNIAALIDQGISGLFAGSYCKPHHLQQAEKILNAVGEVVWIEDEKLMDAVTAVSGTGPAYYFLLTEALAEAGEALGLPADIASKLALHTARGAGVMAVGSELDVRELRQRVTSPGGTTQAAMKVFRAGAFNDLVHRAVAAAATRSHELS